jgi:hypothetical protein
MTVEIIKGSKRISRAAKRLAVADLPYKSVTLLPIPTSRDGVTVCGTDIGLEELFSHLDSSCAVCGWGLPEWFAQRLKKKGVTAYDALYDEDFQKKNAELTALGVLGDLIGERGVAPSEVRFGIIGYGRIGSALVKYLAFVGASPIVFSGRESVRAALGEWGIECLEDTTPEALSSVDVLINTAPRSITDQSGAQLLKRAGVSVFDLASGENFGGAEEVVRLRGVPERVFPDSAGDAYAEAIIRNIGRK